LTHDQLTLYSRCHQNSVENVPIALVFAAIAELNGGNKKILNYSLAALFALRVMHSEFGLLGKNDALGFGRPLGYFGTAGWTAAMAGYATYLVKGYWGY
jgi:uncharacterized membrane protein YecN with MAPEG domain